VFWKLRFAQRSLDPHTHPIVSTLNLIQLKRSKISEIAAAGDCVFVLTSGGICVVYDRRQRDIHTSACTHHGRSDVESVAFHVVSVMNLLWSSLFQCDTLLPFAV
jgi:hypothetical protein